MTTEQKAKAYDEAIERAKKYHKQLLDEDNPEWASEIEELFPELAESEDELAWLKKYIEEEAYSLSMDIRDNEDRIKLKKLQRSLAWLEKQGTSYTKRDVDDTYVEGMAFAKAELEKQCEQKSDWSEEDEVKLQACIDCLQAESLMGKVDTVMTNWLKSLKQRIGGKQ